MDRQAEDSEDWLAIPAELGVWRDGGTISEHRLRLWALVLEARDIPFHAEQKDQGWQVLVPDEYLLAARNELYLFEKENRAWPPPKMQPRPLMENWLANLSVLILLATFYNITRLDISLPGHQVIDWHAAGNAHAAKILAGEWWRLVTALTLHSNVEHLLANLAIGGFFIIFLCRELGSGLAWSLILLSGILGNLANALLQQPQHMSIGASTAVFGTVGIIAAINMLHHRHTLQKRWLLPIAAALSLLAILGTEGENTDLGAHLFGFISGTVLGLASEALFGRHLPPGKLINALLAFISTAIVLSAWAMAVTTAP